MLHREPRWADEQGMPWSHVQYTWIGLLLVLLAMAEGWGIFSFLPIYFLVKFGPRVD